MLGIAEVTDPSTIMAGDVVFAQFSTRSYLAKVDEVNAPDNNGEEDDITSWRFKCSNVTIMTKPLDKVLLRQQEGMVFMFSGDGTDELPQQVWVIS